jgi:DNA-binding Lrp family transcriptional regulator
VKDWKKRLLEDIQSDFPISPTPYADLAREFSQSEEKVIQAIEEFKKSGVVRRIGASIDSRKAGYVSTLVGCKVDPDQLEKTAEGIGYNTGVTHSYQRDGDLNFWFTLIVKDEETLKDTLEDYSKLDAMEELHSLPADKVYKIKVHFGASDE